MGYSLEGSRKKVARNAKVGIIGAGWPGNAHAQGYAAAGGYELYAVADLIPQRRGELAKQFSLKQQYATAEELIGDKLVDVVSVCVPNNLHAAMVVAALKAGKHVVCETPPAVSAAEVRKMGTAAEKAGKALLFSMQRRFGGCEQTARQAVAKGLLGEVYHVRAAWMRTRGIPSGTGWYTSAEQAGGGAMSDLGLQMLDVGWDLMGNPKPMSVFASTHNRINPRVDAKFEVEEAGSALIRFENGSSMELASAWAINQPPQQRGAVCRVSGTQGALEVYSDSGALLYRDFDAAGNCRAVALKGPKMTHHGAMMRHLKECMLGKTQPQIGALRAAALMEILQAIYKSAESGRSVNV